MRNLKKYPSQSSSSRRDVVVKLNYMNSRITYYSELCVKIYFYFTVIIWMNI